MELMIVLVIIGILATLAIPRFTLNRESVFSREAIANLRMIGAAERIYRIEITPNAYVSCVNTNDCNNILRLSLNTDHWTYVVTRPGGQATFTATADRIGAGGYLNCQYVFTQADAAPVGNANCPP